MRGVKGFWFVSVMVGFLVLLLAGCQGMSPGVPSSAVVKAELQQVEVVAGTDDAVIEVQQGQEVSFTIKLWATDNISNQYTEDGPAKASIPTLYEIQSGGTVSTGNPSQDYAFWSKGGQGQVGPVTWQGAPTPYQVTAWAKAATGAPPGDYTIRIQPTLKNNEDLPGGHKLNDNTPDTLIIRVKASELPTPPLTITAPDDITVEGNTAGGATNVSLGEPTVSGGKPPYTIGNNAPPVFPLGETTVTWTVTDAADNTASDTQKVTVVDTTPPEGSITINGGAQYTNSTAVTLKLLATDNVGVTGYRVANGADASGGTTVSVGPTTDFSANISWTLPSEDGEKTVAVQYCDAAGNWSPNYTDTIILDETPPTLTWGTPDPAPNASGWNNTSVSIPFETSDNLSGVASASSESPLVFDTEGKNQTKTVTVTDNAGNSATFTSQSVNIDKTPPVVTVDLPDTGKGKGVYLLNEVVSATWTATDSLSGFNGSTTTGSIPLDTSSVGTKTLTIDAGTAVDLAGNESAAVQVPYSVRYDFCGIRPPINPDGTSIFKLGSTVPVKFQLKDAKGNFVSSATARIYVTKISNNVTGTEVEVEAVSTSAATTGNLFRYDPTDNQYIFNLSTKNLSTGTWKIRIALDDGTNQFVNISLR
jgi:hypothetical protein